MSTDQPAGSTPAADVAPHHGLLLPGLAVMAAYRFTSSRIGEPEPESQAF